MKDRVQSEEQRKHNERIRELNTLAEKLGCSLTQLAIAWCLKNETVQCLLLGASSVEQLFDSIQSLQVSFLLLVYLLYFPPFSIPYWFLLSSIPLSLFSLYIKFSSVC